MKKYNDVLCDIVEVLDKIAIYCVERKAEYKDVTDRLKTIMNKIDCLDDEVEE